jgi:hypothetical protein
LRYRNLSFDPQTTTFRPKAPHPGARGNLNDTEDTPTMLVKWFAQKKLDCCTFASKRRLYPNVPLASDGESL